jgi:hypothetical protein
VKICAMNTPNDCVYGHLPKRKATASELKDCFRCVQRRELSLQDAGQSNPHIGRFGGPSCSLESRFECAERRVKMTSNLVVTITVGRTGDSGLLVLTMPPAR